MRNITRALHYCAVVDPAVMASASEYDHRRYSIVGSLVLVTSVAAAGGWGFKTYLGTGDWPISIAVGLTVALAIFCIERMLIASISPTAGLAARIGALGWRALLASITSALIVFPFMLWSFRAEIATQLDHDKIAMLEDRRTSLDHAYNLDQLRSRLTSADDLLSQNRDARAALPPDIVEIETASSVCESELTVTRKKTVASISVNNKRIASDSAELSSIISARRLPNDFAVPIEALKQSIAALKKRNNQLNEILSNKQRHCAEIASDLATAKDNYYAGLDTERDGLLARRDTDQNVLATALTQAGGDLTQSRSVIDARMASGLQADTEALLELIYRNPTIRGIVIGYYLASFLIELLPILSKIVLKSTYDNLLAIRFVESSAERAAKLAELDADSKVRMMNATAMAAGTKRYLRETKNRVFYEAAEDGSRIRADQLWMDAFFNYFDRAHDMAQKRLAKVQRAEDELNEPSASRVFEGFRNLIAEKLFRRGAHTPSIAHD
jgi:hypothetical protein